MNFRRAEKGRKDRRKFVITIVAIAMLVVFWVVTGTEGYEVPYVTIQELNSLPVSAREERLRLGGKVQEGSIVRNETDQLSVAFVLVQEDETLPVEYHKLTPDMFKDGIDVIVEGRYVDERFVADNLMTKCASRYEGDLTKQLSY